MRKSIVRKAISALLLLVVAAQTSSCGTLLYPERRGQHGGHIDPVVFVLDAVGLFFWIIPGVVAFAVDFSTGTIYLPYDHPHYHHDHHGSTTEPKLEEMMAIETGNKRLTMAEIEALVEEEIGRDIDLRDPSVAVRKL